MTVKELLRSELQYCNWGELIDFYYNKYCLRLNYNSKVNKDSYIIKSCGLYDSTVFDKNGNSIIFKKHLENI